MGSRLSSVQVGNVGKELGRIESRGWLCVDMHAR